jgi:poly-gamma-glutamate capsule biosynthesis protein CapA/YwtB (metallophosphatase superfamily)
MRPAKLLLCGDVMTGRGIDQVLRFPGDPQLHEPGMRDARHYVRLAERRHGDLPRGVAPGFVWGDALEECTRERPDCRIVNLETAVTASDDWCHGKDVHYRMHPANIDCLTAAGIDVATLANNHTLDWGTAGLVETLAALAAVGIHSTGAGRDLDRAQQPAIVPLAGGGRCLVFGVGSPTSGIPLRWAAGPHRPGLDVVPVLSTAEAHRLGDRVRDAKRPGDIAVVSIHWGSNWGYDVADDMAAFARAVIDGGADIVHGHSSHHARPIEIYRGRLILYGCGECIDDYEGITGYEAFRGDLVMLAFAAVARATGQLVGLRIAPMQIHRFSLRRASPADARALTEMLADSSAAFGTAVAYDGDGIVVSPGSRSGST